MYRSANSRSPITPQLALRVAILGGIALVVFGLVFFRLWYLQILSGDRYLAEANDNRIRELTVQAPRGRILDRNGEVLVENRTGLAVQLELEKLPDSGRERAEVYDRLGEVIDMDRRRIQRRISDHKSRGLQFTAVTLRQDVDYEKIYFLLENAEEFPGVKVQRVFLRRYPRETRAAHLLGYTGEITAEQLEQKENSDREQGDIIGQSGIERVYDRYLRGENGASRIQVDAAGRPKGELREREAVPGNNLRLTIDSRVQAAGEEALASTGLPGGLVALNPKNGEVIAMASHPTFDPAVFTRPMTQEQYDRLIDQSEASPISNRAFQGLYPAGSSWKAVTAVAGLETGVINPSSIIDDPGSFDLGGITIANAGGSGYGAIDVRRAMQVSSNVFYAKLGQRVNSHGDGLGIQTWAKRLGISRPSGIDLPGESRGVVPDPDYRKQQIEQGLMPEERPWSVGDNVNLAIGQGDLQTNPLHMALAYATIARGGRTPTPRLGLRVEDAAGRSLQEIQSKERRRVEMKAETRRAVMEGLRLAAMEGTAAAVFGHWPFDVAGKTGTAERPLQPDQAWFVAVAPYDDPEIVVALTVERGGFGGETAAPLVGRVLEAHFNIRPRQTEESQSAGQNFID